ncbi:hypothetical protein TNCV_4381571 [Trichonephila clavipes]|nr:hypothetical protein TNCV_4381571 [Trichonephila clavipes]
MFPLAGVYASLEISTAWMQNSIEQLHSVVRHPSYRRSSGIDRLHSRCSGGEFRSGVLIIYSCLMNMRFISGKTLNSEPGSRSCSGRGKLGVTVTNSVPTLHELEPSCHVSSFMGPMMHVKSFETQSPHFSVAWRLGDWGAILVT